MKHVSEMTVQEIRDLVESELRKQGAIELWSDGANVFVDNKNIGASIGVIMPNDNDKFDTSLLASVLEDFDNNYYIWFNSTNKDTSEMLRITNKSYRTLMWTAKDGWLKY